tara:strand:- start:252 stop:590 length:339 start_codon:yes stop_codon:yes gene_type:complete
METLQDYLNELNTFEVVSVNRDATEVHFSNGLKATYKVEVKHHHSSMTFQAVLQIRLIEDGSAYIPLFWGSTSEEQNKAIVRWFVSKELKFREDNRSRLETEYTNLTKQFRA